MKPMRRWLPPLFAAAVAATLALMLFGPRSVPADLLRLFADDPIKRASTATLIDGAYEIELRVVHGDSRFIAGRLALAGFEVVEVGVERITARLRAPEGVQAALAATGVLWPFTLRVGDRVLGPDGVVEVRRDGRSLTLVPADPNGVKRWIAAPFAGRGMLTVRPRGAPIRIHNRPDEWYATACEGAFEDGVIALRDCDATWISQLPASFRPARDGAVRRESLERIEPAVTEADIWSARALLAGAAGGLAFALFSLALGRRRLADVVARDEQAGSRAGVVGALMLTAVVLGAASLRGESAPFIGSLHAGLLGMSLDGTSPLDLGYFAVVAGFAAALLATLARPSWRRDLICDRAAGARLLRRGAVFTGLAAAALFAAPLIDGHVDVVLPGWTAGNTAVYSAVALGSLALVLAVGSRALGGMWLCAALAVLLPAFARFGGRLVDGSSGVAAFVVLLAAVCAATIALLTRPMGRGPAALRAPVGGILPVSIGAGVAAVFAGLAGELPIAERMSIQYTVAIPLALAAALFELRVRRGLGGVRVSSATRDASGARSVIAVSLVFIAIILAVEGLSRHLYLATFAVLAALTCAAFLDMAVELRTRWRRPTLAPAWSLHQPQLAGLVERALESRGLHCHMRARHLRTLLGIFGAFVPITAMVDRDRIDEAREVIASALG
jgi:hypothetical protein